jgi:hypothetical protein
VTIIEAQKERGAPRLTAEAVGAASGIIVGDVMVMDYLKLK